MILFNLFFMNEKSCVQMSYRYKMKILVPKGLPYFSMNFWLGRFPSLQASPPPPICKAAVISQLSNVTKCYDAVAENTT